MKTLMTLTITLLLASGALFAQGFTFNLNGTNLFNTLQGGANSNTILLKTDNGLFALRSAVLVKYDATTLQQLGEFQIFGPAPEMPTMDAENPDVQDYVTALQNYFKDQQKRQGPALMIASKDSLLVVIGNGFGRINQQTMKLEAKASLLPPTATPPNGGDQQAPPILQFLAPAEPTPGYVLAGTTLYLMRGKEVLAINTTDGTILARTSLPAELQATPNSTVQTIIRNRIVLPMGGGADNALPQ